jgi:phosphatidylglycerophosphatase C
MASTKFVVFDFDGTLYKGDCTVDFYRFILTQDPAKIILLPFMVVCYFLWLIGAMSTQKFKQLFLSYLNGFTTKQLDGLIEKYWSTKTDFDFDQTLVKVLQQHQLNGVATIVITASPRILVGPLVSGRFNSTCIGTELTCHQNKYKLNGPNCKGVHKVQAFVNKYGTDAIILEAYSDNKSDKPLFDKAQHAFVIKQGKVIRLK